MRLSSILTEYPNVCRLLYSPPPEVCLATCDVAVGDVPDMEDEEGVCVCIGDDVMSEEEE